MARILVVEDDIEILKLCKIYLEKCSHKVFWATDVVGALNFLEFHPIDLIITDANLPHISGLEFIERLRHTRRFEEAKIIMMTSNNDEEYVHKSLRSGVDDYIVKPFKQTVLNSKVEKLLCKKKVLSPYYFNKPQIAETSKGTLYIPVSITSISETGVEAILDTYLNVGSSFQLTSFLFREIGFEAPEMEVISCFPLNHGRWRVHLNYCSINEKIIKQIRDWMIETSVKENR